MAFSARTDPAKLYVLLEGRRVDRVAPAAGRSLSASVLVVTFAAVSRRPHMFCVVEFHRLVLLREGAQKDGSGHLPLRRYRRPRGGSLGPGVQGCRERHHPAESDGQNGLCFHLSPSFVSRFSSFFSAFLAFLPARYASLGLQSKTALAPTASSAVAIRSAAIPRSSTAR